MRAVCYHYCFVFKILRLELVQAHYNGPLLFDVIIRDALPHFSVIIPAFLRLFVRAQLFHYYHDLTNHKEERNGWIPCRSARYHFLFLLSQP